MIRLASMLALLATLVGGCSSSESCDSPAPALAVTPATASAGDELRIQIVGNVACNGDEPPLAGFSRLHLRLNPATIPVRTGDRVEPAEGSLGLATVSASQADGRVITLPVGEGIPAGDYLIYIHESPVFHSERISIDD
jgi:hypothetical protein